MKRIYHLATCSTNKAILKQWQPGAEVEMWEIKSQPMTEAVVDEMKALAGSYEALFSRKAVKYREMGLAQQQLTEADYRRLILTDYTFLKRPVAIVGSEIFIGNAAPVVSAAALAFHPDSSPSA